MSISNTAATASPIYFRFQFWWRIAFKSVQIYSHTKFSQDSSIRGWDTTTSGFWKQTAAILKFYFRFHFDISVVISMWFSVGVPNYIQIGPLAAEIWRHSHFQDGGHSVANLLSSSFRFDDVSQFRTSKSIYILNFDNVTQSAAEILLFPVSENKWPPYWNSTSGFHFDVLASSGCDSASTCHISSKLDHPRQVMTS